MLAPVAKPTDFRASFGRLMGELRPERGWVIAVVLLAIVSVVLAVIGPKILANATNVIFAGAIGEQMPAGITVDQAVAALQAQGQDNQAEMIANMPYLVPGEGHRLRAAGPMAGHRGHRLHGQLGVQLGPELHHGRRHPADRVPAP